MNDFLGNLAAEAIGLVAGIIATYIIVARVLESRERSRWRAARLRLLSRLKRSSENALILWAAMTRIELIGDFRLTTEFWNRLTRALEAELADFQDAGANARESEYWDKATESLSTTRSLLSAAVDRANLVLEDRPDLVEIVSGLEEAHTTLTGFQDETYKGPSPFKPAQAEMVMKVFGLHLRLWRALPEIPGIVNL